MQKLRAAMLATTCAVAVVSAMTYVSAQSEQRAPRESTPVRHLVYIATPGDNGTDNQSGIVVLDADKDYSFLKRISYELPASKMPGPKVSGITVSLPLQMLYVTVDGYMTAFDLATDKIAWTFAGESGPIARTRGAASGCCERPWTLPDGKTLLVGSSYNSWWYYIDGGRPDRRPRLDVAPERRQGGCGRHRRAEPEGAALHDLLRNGAPAHHQP